MAKFINASDVKTKKEKVDDKKIDDFIAVFNRYIKKGGRVENGDSSFSMNNGLDKIPTLNDLEFECAVRLAFGAGWELTQYPDNYQSTSYKMKKLIK